MVQPEKSEAGPVESAGGAIARSPAETTRRGLLERLSSWMMFLGMAGGYGLFGVLAARFLYPARPTAMGWLYVADLARFPVGESLQYQTPAGEQVLITRQGEETAATSFIALSSTCPHLGCKVHWESVNTRFFCPCHNGSFDAQGVATGGPPKSDNKSLPRFELKVKNGLLYINAPLKPLPLGKNFKSA